MAKDKGEGEGTKPSSEAKDVAKIQDDTIKAREAETFLPFNRARKKSLFLQPKPDAGVNRVRFLVRQNLDFTQRRVSRVRGFGFLIVGTIHTCLIAARTRLWIYRSHGLLFIVSF